MTVMEGIEADEGEEKFQKLQLKIYDMIIKSLVLATPHVTHLIKSS